MPINGRNMEGKEMKNCTKRILALGTALALTSGVGGGALAAEAAPAASPSSWTARP